MNDSEIKSLLLKMNALQEEVTSSREKALAFLQSAGILDNDGQYTPPYQNLCIPPEQG